MGRLQRYYNSGRPFSISFILAGSFERVNRLAGRSTGKDQAGRVLIYIYICTLATNRYRSVGSAPVDSSLITNQGQDVVLARGGSIRQGGKRTVRLSQDQCWPFPYHQFLSARLAWRNQKNHGDIEQLVPFSFFRSSADSEK